eukprot:CCRYP_016949-RB/>CCRYP_016949-RB protein AED:0.11 eAED:0.11 QI:231/0.6/0.66/1/1/1/6/51/448
MMAHNSIRRQLLTHHVTRRQRLFHGGAPKLSPSEINEKKPEDVGDTDGVPVQTFNKTPIVAKLWKTRDWAKRRVMGKLTLGDDEYSSVSLAANEVLYDAASESAVAVAGKHPRESQVGIEYPFSTDQYLLETYRNPWGEIRFSSLVFLYIETANSRPKRPEINADQYLSGKVTWVGSSSMEIRMVISDSEDGKNEWLESYFTFVTLDCQTKKPIKICPLNPETDEERVHFELGAVKAQAKKVARRNKIEIGRPLSEESLKIDVRAAQLLDAAGPLLRMPSLADPNSILMDATAHSNAMVAQPQSRNLHDRIFGGFLMRRAFELAFSTAYMFGGDRPLFLEVDDITFDKPVDVGDLLVLKSRVLYSLPNGGNLGSYVMKHDGLPLVNVEVEAWVTVPETMRAEVSNHFYFTFALPNKETCRTVLPSNIDQARRQASRLMADEIQAGLRP